MKLIFKIGIGLTLIFSVAAHAEENDLQRLAALVDYVAADYPGAVKDGQILAATEYEEQRGLVRDARELAEKLPAGAGRDQVLDGIRRVEQAVDGKSSSQSVLEACRAVRTCLVEELGLTLVPAAPPSLERARTLFAANCTRCHGDDGRADTEEAKKLKPPPVSFRDDERMARISPALAYHALTFGVKDTAMASFDTLPAADRWSLAFYTVGMRHDRADVARGEKSFAATQQPPVAATASRLSALSDGEIDSLLAPQMTSADDRANTIAWLRRGASFAATPGGTFGDARKLLARIGPAPQQQRHALAVAAYLDGIEPHEASLRARDPELATRIEAAFLDLRKTIDTQGVDAALQQNIAAINLLLDRATERRTGPQVAFVAALTIALREGLEAALLIAALLAFLRKSGRSDAARMVHLGWLAAIPLGLATWFVAGALVAGAQRELVEAIVTLVAAAMILMVSHWVLGRHEAKRWVGFLQRRVMALAPGSNPWPLFLLAFIAAYREAFEVVLFYRALLLDVGEAKQAVAFGAAAGAVSIALVVFVLARLGKRLNPRPVMLASSVLLAALAVTLVGRGIRALQEGGYLGLTAVRFPDLSTIGIYPTLQGLLAQGATLLAIFFPSLWERFGRKVPSAPPARPASQ